MNVVAGWLLDRGKLGRLSDNTRRRGAPEAEAEIIEAIGESALRWKKINESHHGKEVEDNCKDGGSG